METAYRLSVSGSHNDSHSSRDPCNRFFLFLPRSPTYSNLFVNNNSKKKGKLWKLRFRSWRKFLLKYSGKYRIRKSRFHFSFFHRAPLNPILTPLFPLPSGRNLAEILAPLNPAVIRFTWEYFRRSNENFIESSAIALLGIERE